MGCKRIKVAHPCTTFITNLQKQKKCLTVSKSAARGKGELRVVDIKTVSGMLGHYSTEFTLDVYTNVTKEMQKDAAKKISGFMAEVM